MNPSMLLKVDISVAWLLSDDLVYVFSHLISKDFQVVAILAPKANLVVDYLVPMPAISSIDTLITKSQILDNAPTKNCLTRVNTKAF